MSTRTVQTPVANTFAVASVRAAVVALALAAGGANAGFTRNIMLTGYWPPTNEMVRQFSTNPAQNPDGWKGGNWKGRGYNVYAFMPEFPGGTGVNSKGEGDFEVDYQDTSSDWWRITADVDPLAIITFSWTPGKFGQGGKDWEIENRNRNRTSWTNDYSAPFQPSKIPPDDSIAPGASRFTTLPKNEIRDAVNAAGLGLNSYIDDTGGGTFLSEYIGYHGLWYQSLHNSPADPFQCFAAGHVHVGQNVTVEQGRLATEITLDMLMNYLDTVIPAPGSAIVVGAGAAVMLRRRR
jgi:hypothetical protein